jgi:hypothetical protein
MSSLLLTRGYATHFPAQCKSLADNFLFVDYFEDPEGTEDRWHQMAIPAVLC